MLRTPPKRTRSTALAPARVDAWLIGAFLLLLASAAAVTVRPIADSTTLELVASKGSEAQKAQRDVVRAAYFIARAAKLDGRGGKDAVPIVRRDLLVVGQQFVGHFVAPSATADVAAHWFDARAPPNAWRGLAPY